MTEYRGLRVSIYRSDDVGDCTLGGVTSAKYGKSCAILVTDDYDHPAYTVGPDDDVVLLFLKQRKLHAGGSVFHAEPRTSDVHHYQNGGNFIYSSDSRFRQLCDGYPIPVHDRIERS